jgi:TRAP-type C4-dicarboxylate transport system permease small subunit
MKFKPAFWTNIFFVLPLALSLINKLYIHSFLILLVILASGYYHYREDKKLLVFDKISATLLILYNSYLCYLSGFKQPYFALIVVFVILAFYFLRRLGDRQEWHLTSVIITLLCILSYIS